MPLGSVSVFIHWYSWRCNIFALLYFDKKKSPCLKQRLICFEIPLIIQLNFRSSKAGKINNSIIKIENRNGGNKGANLYALNK